LRAALIMRARATDEDLESYWKQRLIIVDAAKTIKERRFKADRGATRRAAATRRPPHSGTRWTL
jgi:hypothetical protein